MFNWKQNKSPVIGLDMAEDAIRLLQLSQAGKAVTAAARIPRAAETLPFASGSIRRALQQFGFAGRRIVAALPESLVYVKSLRIAEVPAEKQDDAVRAEAQSALPPELSDSYLQFLVAGPVRQGSDLRQEVILVAAQRDAVDQFVEILHREQLDIASIEFAPCALHRALRTMHAPSGSNVRLIVEICAAFTRVVVTRGPTICLVKKIDAGGAHLQQAVSRKLDITPEEASQLRRRLAVSADLSAIAENRRDPIRQAVFDATRGVMQQLAAEVALCTRYYSVSFRGQPPEVLHLAGQEADNEELAHMLRSATGIPVQRMLLDRIEASAMSSMLRHGSAGEWTLAMGLAAKELQPAFSSEAVAAVLPQGATDVIPDGIAPQQTMEPACA